MNISLKRKLEMKLKETISKIVLFFLYRGINIVKKVDEEVLKEIALWNENIIIKIATYENGPSLIIKKQQNKIIRIKEANKYDIEIIFKSLDAAFLDPEMTMTLPKKATASTGIDALCHAIEAYTCIQKNPLSDAYAISAIKIIMDNIEIAVKNGENKKARLSMANASLMAGIYFSNSMVGLVHAIGHSIGAVSKVPHGDAISILLPYVMEYNFDVVKEEYAKIALYTLPEECINRSEEERAVLLIGKVKSLIKKLNEETGLPKRLKDVKINRKDFEKIAQTSINDGAIIVNAKKADIIDIINILEKAY